MKKAIELDPLSNSAWSALGYDLTQDGQFAAAHEALHRALEIQPEDDRNLYHLGELQLLESRAAEALVTFRQLRDEGLRVTGIAIAEHALGHAKESQQALDELTTKRARDYAFQIAEVHAWRGENGQAFDWLERAYTQRDGGLPLIKIDLLLRSLRGDPRFAAMLSKLKLPA
jgi:tetratricopeptide (TPR) repeat protein